MGHPAYVTLMVGAAALTCLPRSARAQNRPTVDGYRLGQTWRSAGGTTMPCNRDSYGPDSISEKACVAPNGVHLYFRDDTLMQVFEVLPIDPQTNVEGLWHTEWEARTRKMFGPPDSVTREQGPAEVPYRGITAWWYRANWCAFLGLSHYPGFFTKSAESNKESASVTLSLYSSWLRDPKHPVC
jgi:hypothetical protein